MPLYEYECTQCHERTEKRQKFSDPEITVCPHCSGHLERVLSAPAVSFKGGGWYSDLYASPKPKSSDSAKGADNTKGTTSDGGSTATQPAAPSSTPAASSTAGTTASSSK